MTDFVLIHGTTQSALGWEPVRERLIARGHRAVALDLPSDRDDRLAVDYARHVADRVGRDVSSPVVVAHSAYGLLLPALVEALRASHQVWVAAYVPDGRRSLMEELAGDPEELFFGEWLGADPTDDPDVARHFLFHDCDPVTQQWALTTLKGFVPRVLYESIIVPTPRSVAPSTYIVTAADRTLRPAWMCRAARDRLGVEAVEIDAGHCPHVSQPDAVVAVLTSLTTETYPST